MLTFQVFTFLFAICTLREPLKLFRMMVMTLLLTGVVIITRPSILGFTPDEDKKVGTETETTSLGYVAAWLVPVLSAFVSIWTRQCRNVNAQLLMFWFGCGSLFWAIVGGNFLFPELFSPIRILWFQAQRLAI